MAGCVSSVVRECLLHSRVTEISVLLVPGGFLPKLVITPKPNRYTFYDGPPFATGLPHYGHILAGTIKDIVTRYAHQNGFHVERRFGWDCHGLPVVRFISRSYLSEMPVFRKFPD